MTAEESEGLIDQGGFKSMGLMLSGNNLRGRASMTSRACRTVRGRGFFWGGGGCSSACRGFGTDSGTAVFPLGLASKHIHHVHLEADLKMNYLLFPLRAETLVWGGGGEMAQPSRHI